MNKDSSSQSRKGNKQQKDNDCAPIMHSCEYCGKTFASGKALGGHKRLHIQAEKKRERELLGNKNNEKLNCYICKKDFPSEKSLFGHMRSHPHRDWKGIQPPNTSIIIDDNNNGSSSSASNSSSHDSNNNNNDCDIDLSKCLPLPSWGKTDTRGRESVLSSAIRALASMIDELSDYDDKLEAIMKKEEEKTPSKKRKLIVRFDNNNEENLETILDGYKCNICDESFPTFQGLRRHRSSSHNNKDKKCKISCSTNDKKGSDEEEANNNSKDFPKFDLNKLPNDDKDEN